MGTVSISRRAAYWALFILFSMNLLNYIDRYILAAVLPKVQESLGLQDRDALAGSLTTIFFTSYALCSPFIGWFGDRVNRRVLLAIGVGIWSIATFGSGLAETYGQMIVARSFLGVGEATYTIIAPTLLADFFPRNRRNKVLAAFYMAIPVGAALGYLLGGWIEKNHASLHLLPYIERALEAVTGQHFDEASKGWRMAFFVVGLPGLVVALSALLIREPRRGASENVTEEDQLRYEKLPLSWSTYGNLLRNRSFVYNTLAVAMFTFALGGLQVWAPKFFWKERGMDLTDADARLGLVTVIGGLVGPALGGWLGDLFARRNVRGSYFKVCAWAMLAATPMITLVLLLEQPLLIFGSMLIGLVLCFTTYGPTNTILVNVSAPRIRAAALAVNVFFIHLFGDIPSPYVMGWVSDATGRLFWGLAITIPSMFLSGVFFYLGARYLDTDQEAVLREMQSTGRSA